LFDASMPCSRLTFWSRAGEYEVRRDERDDCYILSGFDKGFSKTRFEVVSQPTKRNGRAKN